MPQIVEDSGSCVVMKIEENKPFISHRAAYNSAKYSLNRKSSVELK